VKFRFIATRRGIWPADWTCRALGAVSNVSLATFFVFDKEMGST
jgi:hypothetical protein